MTTEKEVYVTGGCNASKGTVVISILFFISIVAVTITITLVALDRFDTKYESGEFEGEMADGDADWKLVESGDGDEASGSGPGDGSGGLGDIDGEREGDNDEDSGKSKHENICKRQ